MENTTSNQIYHKLFHLICAKNYTREENYDENYFQKGFADSKKFLNRFAGMAEFKDKTVLDVGCGYGTTCIYMALAGAKHVVGVDIDEHRLKFAKSKLATDYPHLLGKVEFKLPNQLQAEKFDVLISKDSFEHISDPEEVIIEMQKYLNKKGIIAIGFGPLWKAPNGGHIGFMTKVPWAHLLFPESVIMQERKRFRPDEDAEVFEQIRGGLNKITLHRFSKLIESSHLDCIYFETNVSERKTTLIPKILASIPFCKEFFTFNVYCVLASKS